MANLTQSLFSFAHSRAGALLRQLPFPWEILPILEQVIVDLSAGLPSDFQEMQPQVWVGPGTTIAPTAVLRGPIIIGANCDIRHSAFIRENVLIGDAVVIGNSCEIKNAVLFDGVQVPHFNYVGDSILGYKAHLGAGAILSNFKNTGDEIHVVIEGKKVATGLHKLGGLLGDEVEVGCNAVLFPGTIVGRQAIIYPLVPARGNIPANTILKNDGNFYARAKHSRT